MLTAAAGEREVRCALLARLNDDEWWVREEVVKALAVSEAEVRAALLARLGDDAGSVRFAAAQVLAGGVGEREVRDSLPGSRTEMSPLLPRNFSERASSPRSLVCRRARSTRSTHSLTQTLSLAREREGPAAAGG